MYSGTIENVVSFPSFNLFNMNVAKKFTLFALHVATCISVIQNFTLSMDMEFSAITIVFSEARYLQAALSTGFVVMQFIAWQQRKDAWKRSVLRCLSIWANIFGGIAAVHSLVGGQFRTM